MSSPPRRPATASPSPHNKSNNSTSSTGAPPDAIDGYDPPYPPPPHRHHAGMGPPPLHEFLMPGEYPFPPPHHHQYHHPMMMGMPPDHYLMPPMHPSDLDHHPLHPPPPPLHHHHHPSHHHHHNMMADFPQPPPPARFMPPRPRVMRQPPRVPNRIIVESSNFDSSHHQLNRRNGNGMDHPELDDHDMPKRKERAPSSSSFPTKLYKILADPQYREHIAWLPHGRAWRVLKPKAFEEDVIPKFFRSERYASFMRQVNGWGFKRITEGPDLNSYYHEMFLRGLPQVCAKMRRPQKGQGASQNKDALGQAPDFYKISMFAPLPPLEEEETNQVSPDRQQQQQQQHLSPKTPDRTTSKSTETAEVTNSSSSATNESSPLPKQRAKIADTDSKHDSDEAEGEDDDDEARDDVDDDDDKNTNHDSNNNKPQVTPTRPETKTPSSPKTLFTDSPSYVPRASSPNQSDPYIGSTLSPTDMGRDFVELPNSAGNSVRSWTNSPSEEDLMFGGSISNAFSPHDQQQQQHFHQLHSHNPYYNHHPGTMMPQQHLHPRGGMQHPLPNFPVSDSSNSSSGGGGRPPGRPIMIPPRGGFDIPPIDPTDGLSEADLSYLTYQNRILLSQATRSSGNGGAGSGNTKKMSKTS